MIQEKKSLKDHIKDYIIITLASVLYGLAISQFLDPNDIAPGGVSGLSMIINRIVDIEVGTIIFSMLQARTPKTQIYFTCLLVN